MSIRGPRKGENYELNVDLNREYREKRKDAIKRTIASITVGKDVSGLFSGVLKNMQTEDLEQKKLVYLYLKLYDLKSELVIENGFLDQLHEMMADSNPMIKNVHRHGIYGKVVANTVAALTDIHNAATAQPSTPSSYSAIFTITASILNKLLIALNEYEKESEHICERVVPQFQHANGSVVLAAVKVVMIHIRGVRRDDLVKQLMRKMAPPLVTLLSSPPEVQWVALRNINILQKQPDVLSNEMRVFFCKYNDPLSVKVEKLEIMVRLANEKNVDALLSELKEYASKVDVDFVRKSIKAIGQAAVKIDTAAERCVNVLLELISTRVSYVVQEAVVVMKDIFRKYPSTYEGVIPTLCGNRDELDEPEAKASLIWIIGEYANKIDNADELLVIFVDSFTEESYPVQLQTLTAVRVLTTVTKDCDSPDVRDRAYIYWRLLSTDPGAAKAVVLAHGPPISTPRTTVSPALLEELLGEISAWLAYTINRKKHLLGEDGSVLMQYGRETSVANDRSSTKKALQTVAAGQQAENLLYDFDDAPAVDEEPSGLAATQVFAQTPAAANLLAGTSSNSWTTSCQFLAEGAVGCRLQHRCRALALEVETLGWG
ncbi:Beta-adaptin-like protein C [Termitomyces sp. J132]|nr:Beta-adaptin-like protein C [Termitomyces sp. J132]